MKQFLSFLFIFLICNVKTAKCQEYVPTLTNADSVKWYYVGCFEGCATTIYTARIDTAAPGYFSKKVYLNETYYGQMREDTGARKVYFQSNLLSPFIDSTEFVMYDYSLQVGDSVDMKIPYRSLEGGGWSTYFNIGWCTLDSITTFATLVGNRRLFIFHQNNNLKKIRWLEGTGILHFGWTNYLNCCFNDTTHVYKADFDSPALADVHNFSGTTYRHTCSVYIPGAVSRPIEHIDVTLYPNPANNTLQLLFPSSKMYTVQVVNMFGNVVSKASFSGKEKAISLYGLVNGFYTVVISTEEEVVIKRFVKSGD